MIDYRANIYTESTILFYKGGKNDMTNNQRIKNDQATDERRKVSDQNLSDSRDRNDDLILDKEKGRLEELKNAMDYIKTTYVSGTTPKVYTLEGLSAIKSILFGLLEKKSDIWIYGLAENESIINMLNDKLMHSFHLERIKKGIDLKLLFYKIPQREIKAISSLKFTEARLLPKNQQSKTSQITQIVCDGFVYITLWIHPLYTIVIENDIIAKEYTDLYEILWDVSKKVE